MPQARDEAGNIWEVDAQGNPVRLVQPASQGQIIPNAPDPTAQYQGPQAEADLARTQASTANAQVDARVAQATAPSDIRLADAQARKAEAEAAKIASGKELTATERANAITGYQSALALEQIITDLQTKYEAGPGATSGLSGVQDWFPSEANQRFDKAANAARGTVGQALGFTGGQLNSAAEAQMNIGPFIPQAGDRDGTIEDSIQRLRDLQQQAKDRSIAILGGVPDENGMITPLDSSQTPQFRDNRPNALTMPRAVNSKPALEAARFGETKKAEPYPPEMLAEHSALVQELIQEGGRVDPQAYAAAREKLDQKYGYQGDRNSYVDWAGVANEYLEKGGASVPTGITPEEEDMSTFEFLRNSAVSNPGGAALTGYFDSATMGGITALAGNKMAALGEQNPASMMGGQVLGAMTGTAGIAKAGREAAKRAMPKALGGGSRSQLARNVAADATYGAAYGAMTEGDPLTGAAFGLGGSLGGQLAGKALKGVAGGAGRTADAQTLQDAGVRMTTGQQAGGFLKGMEDAATSIPGVGDVINARRLEGLQDFNRAAFREAGEPIGYNSGMIGEEGMDAFRREGVSGGYRRALDGQQFTVDNDFAQAIAARQQQAARLPQSTADETQYALQASMDRPLSPLDTFSGKDMQRVYQNLQRRAARMDKGQDASSPDGAQVLRGALDDLGDTVNRQAPGVMPDFQAANQAYGRGQVLQDAVAKGMNTEGVFSPAQLGMAARASGKKYGGTQASTNRPFFNLQRAGQNVLPSTLPDSGTPKRVLTMALPGAIGGGAGVGAAIDGQDGAMTGGGLGAALAALLAAGGTRKGQAGINAALFSRPEKAKKAARLINRKRGLFGSAGAGLAVTQ